MADTTHEQIEALEKRLKKQPRSPLFAQLAGYYLGSGRTDDALRVCDEGLAHHPFYTTGHLIKGKALMALKMTAEAHREFALVHDLLPSSETVARLFSETSDTETELAEPTTLSEAPPSVLPIDHAPEPTASVMETNAPEPSSFAEPVATTEDVFGAGAPAAEEPSPFSEVERPTAEPAMAAPTAEETFEDFSARLKQELAGTENTLSLDEYLSGNISAPQTNQIEELAEKLQNAKPMTPVIDLSLRTSEGGGAGMSSGFVTPTLAEIYVKQGWFDDAIRAYKTLATTKPEEKENYEKRIAEIEEMKKQQS
ncbi:MAG: hypothetical protein ACRDGA_10635 [Bacteroidota bacterium]